MLSSLNSPYPQLEESSLFLNFRFRFASYVIRAFPKFRLCESFLWDLLSFFQISCGASETIVAEWGSWGGFHHFPTGLDLLLCFQSRFSPARLCLVSRFCDSVSTLAAEREVVGITAYLPQNRVRDLGLTTLQTFR